MTHIENITHILKYGITHHSSQNSNPNYISIGDGSLISKRDNLTLPNGKKLGIYIPFYFGARMPMLFVIKQGSNSVRYNIKSIDNEDIIYCITNIEQVMEHDLEYIFSNGHAVNDLTEFFNSSQINRIHSLIDKKAIDAKYWIVEHDLDLKRRKEAEFLIADDIPVNAILGYAVYNSKAKQKLLDFGVKENKIVIKPNYYF